MHGAKLTPKNFIMKQQVKTQAKTLAITYAEQDMMQHMNLGVELGVCHLGKSGRNS